MSQARVASPKVIAEGRFLQLLDVEGWEYAHRKKASGVVAVVGVTDERAIVLTEQFRRAVGRSVVDLPAGLAGDTPGDEGEALESAARRELLEETGFEATRMRPLMSGPPSPGMTSEIVTLFLAEGLRRVSAGGGLEDEGITVHVVALSTLRAFLAEAEGRGALVDLKIFAGLLLAGEALPR